MARADESSDTVPVSICVPVYNGAPHLRECLDSALSQTVNRLELLIVDDGSTDGSLAIAEGYARSDSRVRLSVNETNLGLVQNWNRCVDLAKGSWIKFLFQDDVLERECVERMLHAAPPTGALVVCRRSPIYDDGLTTATKAAYQRYAETHNLAVRFNGSTLISPDIFADHMVDFPTSNCIGEPTFTLIRRSALDQFGRFHLDLIHTPDWECVARIALQTGLCYVDEPLAHFRVHRASTSAKSWATRRFRREIVDPLIILREILYAPLYERVRTAAAARRPPVDLRWRFSEAADQARRLAVDADARAEWQDIVRKYPELEEKPTRYRIKLWIKRRLPDLVLALARRIRGGASL